jgi:hypothetical protein
VWVGALLLGTSGVRNAAASLILVVLICFVPVSLGPETNARFRAAFAPILWLGAAHGWIWLWNRFESTGDVALASEP